MTDKKPNLKRGDIVLITYPPVKKWVFVGIITKVHKSDMSSGWLFDTIAGIDKKIGKSYPRENWIYKNLKIKKLGHIKI